VPWLNVRVAGENVTVAVTGTAWVADSYPGADAVMLATPIPTPVTCGWVAGAVDPPGINTLDGLILKMDGLLLTSVTVNPGGGAGVPRTTGNCTEAPGDAVTPCKVIVPGLTTVMLTVFTGMPGAVMRIVVEPAATPDTGTIRVLAFASIVTLDGTDATPGLSEVSVSVKALGAGAGNTNVRFCVVPRLMVALDGPTSVGITRTACVSPVRPTAEAVMFAVPKFRPVTCGWMLGMVAPAGIYTFVKLRVTFEVSLLARVTKTPVVGVAASFTGNTFDSPGPTVTPEASMIPDDPFTVTEAVALSTFGAPAVAVMVAEPRFLAVTGTVMLVVFAPKDNVEGTVATFVLLDASEIASPEAGAGEESIRLMF
jgi:hypothetical protein